MIGRGSEARGVGQILEMRCDAFVCYTRESVLDTANAYRGRNDRSVCGGDGEGFVLPAVLVGEDLALFL